MESVGHVTVPLRVGGKKMRKRRELDALVAHSLAKSSGKRHIAGNGIASHDQLLSNSTDDQEDYSWPKIRTQSRCRRKRFSCVRTCGPLILVSCIFLSLGFMYWLYFDIRQQVAEYRIRIEQVSATSQNVPEALQKWHETSKNLEQNQTALNGKLREIQQVLSNFSTELKQLRDTIEKKKENSQEAQLNSLKSSVAGLGSKIEDALTRIVALEDQRTKDQGEQKTLRQSVDDLQVLLNKVRNNSSPASMDNTLNNATEQTIANIREQLSAQIENMSQNFTGELQALQQKNIWLGRDVSKHEKSISELIDNSANVSSHVKSVENIWVDMKANLTSLEVSAKQMSEQIDALQNATSGFKTSLGTVRDQCDQYGEQNNVINGEIEAIKKRLEEAERRQVAPTASSGSLNSTNADKDTISKLHQLFDSSPTQSTSQTAGSESEPKQPIAPTSRQPATIAVPSSGVSSSSGSSTITTTTTTATAPAASPSANVGGGGMM
ncbi:myosin-10 isoform X2 [Armigeres subalbatus]|uniref:myosin-10 isoform X2 n=1 Tax=Armigeres subalbatus TaxID=124917 RepID=UPI002ED4B5DE